MGKAKTRRISSLPTKVMAKTKEEFHPILTKWNDQCAATPMCASNERFSCDDCDNWTDLLDRAKSEVGYDVPACRALRDSCCRKWDYTWLVAILSVVLGLMVIALIVTIARGVTAARPAPPDTGGGPILVPLA